MLFKEPKQSGASKIIAIDISEARLEQAREFGATHGVVANREDLDFVQVREEVRTLTDGRGADYAFECTANSSAWFSTPCSR